MSQSHSSPNVFSPVHAISLTTTKRAQGEHITGECRIPEDDYYVYQRVTKKMDNPWRHASTNVVLQYPQGQSEAIQRAPPSNSFSKSLIATQTFICTCFSI